MLHSSGESIRAPKSRSGQRSRGLASKRGRRGTQPLRDGATRRAARPGNGSADGWARERRSEEHTSELQSLMRISYAVFCLKKKSTHTHIEKYIKHQTNDK